MSKLRWDSPPILFLRSAFWTVLFPGTMAGYIPWRFFNVTVDRHDLSLLDMVGIAISLCGVVILVQSVIEFARRGRGTLSPADPARELVVSGMYRWVRNPMYVGVMLVLLGQVLITGSLALAVYTAAFFVVVNLFTRRFEEPYLQRTFGSSYELYRANVRRWIPRLSPWSGSMRAITFLLIAATSSFACADRDDVRESNTADAPARPDAVAETPDSSWRVVAVRDASNQAVPGDASSHIVFASGDTLVVPLIHVEILSTLRTASGTPWIVASGVECSHCDAPKMVVFLPAARGHAERPLRAYAYPGDQLEGGVEDGEVLARNRMFLGSCLDRGPGAVVFEEAPDSAGSWITTVRRIALEPAFADSVVQNGSTAERVADAVRRGECKEVPGQRQYVL